MQPPDVAVEMKLLGIDDDDRQTGSPRTRNGVNSETDDIAHDRQAILEISKMADRMSLLLQETRNNTVEADDRLRKVEADLKLIALEK